MCLIMDITTPHGALASMLDFSKQVRFYVYFQSNILVNGMNSFIPPPMG